MQHDFNYNYVKKLNFLQFRKIYKKIKTLTPENWEEYSFRQNTYSVHEYTRTIPIIFDESFEIDKVTYTKWYSLFENDLRSIKKILMQKYGNGYINRCIIVKLLSGRSIIPHIDNEYSLSLGKRIHLPVVTNKNVKFFIGGEYKNIKKGEMWEINNSNKLHSVYNNSNLDRIHLILDYVVTD